MILIDLNNLGFASTASYDLHAGSVETGGVFGVLKYLHDIRSQFPGKMIVLHDGHSWRYNEYPDYKGNRKFNPDLVKLKERWVPQKKLTATILRDLGVTQILSKNMEADDLAARIVSQAKEPVVLVSGDRDWTQLVSETVMWVNPIGDGKRSANTNKPAKPKRATLENFNEAVGHLNPWRYIQAKALAGDAGDNIHPVGGIGDVGAKWIFDNYGSVEGLRNEWMTSAANKMPKKIQDFMQSDEKQRAYDFNLRMVWLNHPKLPPATGTTKIAAKYDREAFLSRCGEYAFQSIVRDPDRFLAPFEEELV